MTTTRESRRTISYWVVPATAVAIGIVYLVAGLVGGDNEFAVFGLVSMVLTGVAVVVAARWSETARGILDRRDERISAIDRAATTFSGLALITAVLVMFVVEIARGDDGQPYAALGAIAGVTYLASLVWLRFRR